MNNEQSFQKLAAWAAIISAPLAIGSLVTGLMAVDFNFEAFSNMLLFISVGSSGADLFRWGMILDMLGYYLFLAPAAFLLWHWLKPKGPVRVAFYTFCGLAYILTGAIGASILAAVCPPIIIEYAQAAGQQREIQEAVFGGVMNMVYGGLWNLFEVIPGGVWWLGIGLLMRNERPGLGIATIILGCASLLDAFGEIFNVEMIAMAGLFVYLYFAPFWALWLGIDLLRNPVEKTA